MLSKQGKVTVTKHPETGEVVTESQRSPGHGYVRVEQERISAESGYLNKSMQSALIGGDVEELRSLGLKAGDNLPGRIVIEESTTPFFDGQDPKINPETGEILRKDGQAIYRQTRYTEQGNAQDNTIQHDRAPINVDQEEKEQEVEEAITA